MRLGIDLLPLQSEGSRDRGVGRYAAHLLRALAAHSVDDEFILYRCRDLPTDRVPDLGGPAVTTVDLGLDEADPSIQGRWADLAAHNPERLDALLLLNPFELSPGFEPPPRTPGGPPILAVLYDLIPLLLPDAYLEDPSVARRYERRCDIVRRYDALLAISDATRRDAVDQLGVRPDRVVALPPAIEPRFRPADPAGLDDPGDRAILDRHGLGRPFLLHVGGRDDRKNVWAVIEALAALDPSLRGRSTFAVVGDYGSAYTERIKTYAADHGVGDDVRVLGPVDDASLEALYRRCAGFAFPSLYEGLGLPLLEAMRSGSAVIGGRNSSQVDVVGDAGHLVDPTDSEAIAGLLGRFLADPGYAAELGRRAAERTASWTWDRAGRAARDAVSAIVCVRPPRPHFRIAFGRPRIGFVSPMPPKETGIADYAARVAEALADSFHVDLFHEGDYVPEIGLRDRRFCCVDRDVFPRRTAVLPYRALIYQMGNSWYHRAAFELLRARPGIAVLHDFNLAGFHYWYAHQAGVPPGHFDRVVDRERDAGAIESDDDVFAWSSEPGGIQGAAIRRGVHFNRMIFERSRFVAVHSPWCRDLVRASIPEFLEKTVVLPMGATLNVLSPGARAATRARFGIPLDAVVFGCFGNLTRMKMYIEVIDAFAEVRRAIPTALLLFVGKDWEGGDARRHASESGVIDRTVFLGKTLRDDYERLVAAVDVGLCLRRPPTHGETSASLLDLLRSGVAAVVTDVASFRDYPDAVVEKWDPSLEGVAGLAERMAMLASDSERRRSLAGAAVAHVRDHHDWRIAANAYQDLIARCAEAGDPEPAERPTTPVPGGPRR